MDYSMLLAYGLAGDLDISRGSGPLDQLSDYELRDIGYKRVAGRVVKDQEPFDEPAVQRRGWSWSLLGRNLLTPKVSRRPATLA